jgi:hypothetical protein
MKIGHWLAAAALLFSVAAASQAQDVTLPDRGTTEYSISGNIAFDSDTAWNAAASWAPFISPNLQWGIALTAFDGPNISTSGTIGGLVNYYFRSPSEGTTLPYLGAGIAAAYGDLDGSVWNIHGGLKHFFNENVAIFGELGWFSYSDDNISDDAQLNFGISVFR